MTNKVALLSPTGNICTNIMKKVCTRNSDITIGNNIATSKNISTGKDIVAIQ